MTPPERLTTAMAELLIERLEIEARFPINPRAGEQSQRKADDLAAMLIAARTEPPEANDPPDGLFVGEDAEFARRLAGLQNIPSDAQARAWLEVLPSDLLRNYSVNPNTRVLAFERLAIAGVVAWARAKLTATEARAAPAFKLPAGLARRLPPLDVVWTVRGWGNITADEVEALRELQRCVFAWLNNQPAGSAERPS